MVNLKIWDRELEAESSFDPMNVSLGVEVLENTHVIHLHKSNVGSDDLGLSIGVWGETGSIVNVGNWSWRRVMWSHLY